MAKKIHFGNERKARSFAAETGGRFYENKGNKEKPFTVSLPQGRQPIYNEGSDFGSDLNGNGTHWHTAEDL